MTGLLANVRRIEAQRTLRMADAVVMGESGNPDREMLRDAGVTQTEIGGMELKRFQAEQRAKFQHDAGR